MSQLFASPTSGAFCVKSMPNLKTKIEQAIKDNILNADEHSLHYAALAVLNVVEMDKAREKFEEGEPPYAHLEIVAPLKP